MSDELASLDRSCHNPTMQMQKARQLSLFDDPSFFESIDTEFKSARGGLPASLWETYAAFANTNGGTIYLGIVEKGEDLDVQGVPDVEKLRTDLWNTVNNRGKVSLSLLSADDVTVVDVRPGRHVLRIKVPRANRTQRPVFLNNNPFGGTYRRDHTGDYRCTEEEVRRMFADQSAEPADSRVLPDFSMADVHVPSLAQYRNRMASTTPSHPWLGEDDRTLLEKLGGWRRDRTRGTEGLTVAGLLMFGVEQAIRAAEAVPQYHLDYRERLGDDPEQRWSDRLTLNGTWEGNLFQFYGRVMPMIAGTLKTPFQLSADMYRYDESSVAAALREGVVNALIHADYAGQGGIVLDRWVDRIELSNPGTLLLSHEQLLKGGVSECRNKSLQLMFQMMGAGDKAGSGLDKIRSSWAGANLRDPRLRETQRPDRVSLSLPMISILPEDALEQLRVRFGGALGTLRPEEVQILVIALEEGAVTNLRLKEVLTIHRTDLTKILQQLVREDFLARRGLGRGTRYELQPVDESRPKTQTNAGTSTGTSTDTFVNTVSVRRDYGSLDTRPLVDRDAAHWAELMADTADIRSRARMTAGELQQAAERVAERAGWLTRSELASLLGRNSENIRDTVIIPLLTQGVLRMRFTSRNHPAQAYALIDGDTPALS